MAIYVTGDTHGREGMLERLWSRPMQAAAPDKSDCLIVCGDFGCVWDKLRRDGSEPDQERKFLDRLDMQGPTVLFVPGNHENYDRLTGLPDDGVLRSWLFKGLRPEGRRAMLEGYPRKPWNGGTVREIRPSVLMLEDGIFDVGGKRILAIGGAPSHDISDGILHPRSYMYKSEFDDAYVAMALSGALFRVEHVSWWRQEVPSRAHMDKVLGAVRGASVDAVVTHDMPDSVRSVLGLADPNPVAEFLDEIKSAVAYGDWFCGHYHIDEELPDRVHAMYHGIRQLA